MAVGVTFSAPPAARRPRTIVRSRGRVVLREPRQGTSLRAESDCGDVPIDGRPVRVEVRLASFRPPHPRGAAWARNAYGPPEAGHPTSPAYSSLRDGSALPFVALPVAGGEAIS